MKLSIAIVVLVGLGSAPGWAKDRAIDRDWRTGVTVAPGAMTWTSDNFANKKQLIGEIATAQGKTCTNNYAALGWPPGGENPDAIMHATRESYEKAGYTVTQKQSHVDTDTVWIARNAAREAVILWGAFSGSTIYLSCLTAGAPPTNPDKPLIVGILTALGLGGLLGGLWLLRRMRALGAASRKWPSTSGVVTSSEVATYKTKVGDRFMAKVAYDYNVRDTSYVGDQLRFGNYAGARARAEADAARYKVGTPVEVHYDPAKPQTSVLEPGADAFSTGGLVLAITGGLLLAVTALVAYIA